MSVPSTPVKTRVASTSIIQSSPHYTTTRRHSLYGVEDRVVIDAGSIIWKVGFSGEGRPRAVFYAGGNGQALWNLARASDISERSEEDKMLRLKLESCLRSVFHDSLLTDPKARKVILVEHPLLPIYIKDMIARILFENLQVPSISFASSHLLSLLSVGRITGLVLDCGHVESVALPIFSARPLYPQLRTTPLAGSKLTSHIRSLLLLFGTYLPPPTSLSAAVNIPAANRATRVPPEILTDGLVEDIKTRCCFVGESVVEVVADREATPTDEFSEPEVPPSDATHSESDYSHAGLESNISSHMDSSEFSVVSNPRVIFAESNRNENHLQALASMYTRHSTATDLHLRVTPPVAQQTGTGLGTLIIPGWIRERAAELLFAGGDMDEASIAETILDSLLKVPVDLRKTMASSILITGGTSMLPGFIQRLHAELLRTISISPLNDSPRHVRPRYDRYAPLRPLTTHFAILNNPNPPTSESERAKAAGKAPAFSPALMAWVGGSLAGSLKTGGVEVAREKWDEEAQHDAYASMNSVLHHTCLPDWTRIPFLDGEGIASPMSSPQSTRVGA